MRWFAFTNLLNYARVSINTLKHDEPVYYQGNNWQDTVRLFERAAIGESGKQVKRRDLMSGLSKCPTAMDDRRDRTCLSGDD